VLEVGLLLLVPADHGYPVGSGRVVDAPALDQEAPSFEPFEAHLGRRLRSLGGE
jgi:hypothetical protein